MEITELIKYILYAVFFFLWFIGKKKNKPEEEDLESSNKNISNDDMFTFPNSLESEKKIDLENSNKENIYRLEEKKTSSTKEESSIHSKEKNSNKNNLKKELTKSKISTVNKKRNHNKQRSGIDKILSNFSSVQSAFIFSELFQKYGLKNKKNRRF